MTQQYKGYVSRQELIDFCREEVSVLEAENTKLMAAEDVSGLDNADLMALATKLANNHHQQTAFRKITEWAANHHRPLMIEEVHDSKEKQGQEGLKNQYDGVNGG